MVKRLLLMIMMLLIFALLVGAQDTTPEATPEVTAEMTSELSAEATAAPNDTPIAETTADPECPALVSTALDLTQNRCDATGLNEACYGFVMVESESRAGANALERPGDIASINDILTLQLSGLDVTTGQWGVLEFKVQAIVDEPSAETVSQDVQFVVFGDTQISNADEFVPVTPIENTSVYFLPDGNKIIAELAAGTSEAASARLVGDEWLRIPLVLDDGSASVGWVRVADLSFSADLSILPELTSEEALTPPELISNFGPMQAFVFTSGLDDAPCSAAPNSGMLIQTPEGVASVTIVMDEVVIQLSGTGFVQAQEDGEIRFDILDGEAQVTADGETRTAIEGQSVSVDLDENGQAIGAPNDPEPLDLDNIQSLPVEQLDDPVEIAPPLELPPGVPVSGQWSLNFNVDTGTCSDGSVWPFSSVGTVEVLAQQDGLLYGGNFHVSTGIGSYQGDYTASTGDNYSNVLLVAASDQITGTTTINFSGRSCTLSVPFTLQLVGQN
ncbi:MAG: hypothetical protein Q9P44_05395 [Anaerolineae bacterium]|nr:hypothetical protein [Anaerolineae bacterium]